MVTAAPGAILILLAWTAGAQAFGADLNDNLTAALVAAVGLAALGGSVIASRCARREVLRDVIVMRATDPRASDTSRSQARRVGIPTVASSAMPESCAT